MINKSGEKLVDYAVSFANTPEEAAGYADVVISGLETIVTVAGAVGGYKAGKAMVGKLANLKARVPAKVGEAFGRNVVTSETPTDINRLTKNISIEETRLCRQIDLLQSIMKHIWRQALKEEAFLQNL